MVTTNNKSIIGPKEIGKIFQKKIPDIKIPLPEKLINELIEEGWLFVFRYNFGQPRFDLKNSESIYADLYEIHVPSMELETASKRSDLLTFAIDIENQETICECIKTGWVMISSGMDQIPELNYLEQTEFMLGIFKKLKVKGDIFQNLDFENLDNFYQAKNKIEKFIDYDHQRAVNDLAQMKINQYRHSLIEFIYDSMVIYLSTGEIYMRDKHSWTKSKNKSDTFVVVGEHLCPNLLGYADCEPFFSNQDVDFSLSIGLKDICKY